MHTVGCFGDYFRFDRFLSTRLNPNHVYDTSMVKSMGGIDRGAEHELTVFRRHTCLTISYFLKVVLHFTPSHHLEIRHCCGVFGVVSL
jgi:hypothetical protein